MNTPYLPSSRSEFGHRYERELYLRTISLISDATPFLERGTSDYLKHFHPGDISKLSYNEVATVLEFATPLSRFLLAAEHELKIPATMISAARDLDLEIRLFKLVSANNSLRAAIKSASRIGGYKSTYTHSNPDFVGLVDSMLDSVFTPLIAECANWEECQIAENAWYWCMYACIRIDDWSLEGGSRGEFNFDLFNKIFRSAIGRTDGTLFAEYNDRYAIYNIVPNQPVLMEFVRPYCIKLLLAECFAATHDLSILQSYRKNLEFYKPFAGDNAEELNQMLDETIHMITETTEGAIKRACDILQNLKNRIIPSSVSIPWTARRLSDEYVEDETEKLLCFWHKITYGTNNSNPMIFMAMLQNNSFLTGGKTRLWTVSYNAKSRKVIIEVGNKVVKQIVPDPIVQLGLDLYVIGNGFGTSWMSHEMYACEKELEAIAGEGLKLLEHSQQWGAFIAQVAEVVPK